MRHAAYIDELWRVCESEGWAKIVSSLNLRQNALENVRAKERERRRDGEGERAKERVREGERANA